MKALLFLSFNFFFPFLNGADFDSYEVNQLEISPMYDIILFNDIADVIKDFGNDLNSQSDIPTFTESESNENIEDLLMEYQHYLERAHKQRIDYLEKVSGKNKVPLSRFDRYYKKNPSIKNNIQNYYRSYASNNRALPHQYFSNLASNHFEPDQKSNSSFTTLHANLLQHKNMPTENRARNNHYVMSTNIPRPSNEPAVSSCYCKINEIPCKCGCKQCLIAFDSIISNMNSKAPEYFDSWNAYMNPFINSLPEEKTDNDFKIRIKVDVKLPKILEQLTKMFINKAKSNSELDAVVRKESSINYLTPYFKPANTPELFKLNSIPRFAESVPMHTITIHKKKKFRANVNKKHKKKVYNSFGNTTDKSSNADSNINKTVTNHVNNETSFTQNGITEINPVTDNNQNNNNNTGLLKSLKTDQSKDFIYLTLNISNMNDNRTEEVDRLENSIEPGYFKTKDNFTTIVSKDREKREIITSNNTAESLSLTVISLNETFDKKVDKLLTDPFLLYWSENRIPNPNNSSRNITSLIVNIEKRKTKFNMSRENILNNHSIALEKAIFGEVDWNDIDTVAPVFMSFMGKYMHGVLTLCSDTICHSMKCINKTCVHRICEPANRYNNKGHCLGSNNTDSAAKMESIMDLPSNLGFEIVDILQDKMVGKMYGKMTICIGFKCITFVASKKRVLKSKCTAKDLTTSSECPFNKHY